MKDFGCHIHLSDEVKRDLIWWDYLLENGNWKSFFFMQNRQVPAHLELTSDAASARGYSAILGNSWFAFR